MMDSGQMIKLTVSVYICMLTVQSMKACGAMIFNMARVLRHGQMDLNMRVNMHSDASMELDSISGTTAPNTLVSGKKIRFLASASTPGWTVVNTKENGRAIIWKGTATMSGTMEENTKACIRMIKSMDSVSILGLTADATRATGGKENSTVLAHILFPKKAR